MGAAGRIKAENEEIQVILISEQSEIEVVVELLKHGAYDYIVKSKDIRERLLNTVQNIRLQDDEAIITCLPYASMIRH
ncbi:MAG: hypothetical protein WCY58_13610 [Mariniphaga sp.]|nr:hypothetical protein [Mariniphaga sp.]MDD4424838.1 hypothetical protein [Mariniphaga sp.]